MDPGAPREPSCSRLFASDLPWHASLFPAHGSSWSRIHLAVAPAAPTAASVARPGCGSAEDALASLHTTRRRLDEPAKTPQTAAAPPSGGCGGPARAPAA